jgi:tRNA threonylcarbamoyladenosine modification (KEOPS) complex Cgi121 subunit
MSEAQTIDGLFYSGTERGEFAFGRALELVAEVDRRVADVQDYPIEILLRLAEVHLRIAGML